MFGRLLEFLAPPPLCLDPGSTAIRIGRPGRELALSEPPLVCVAKGRRRVLAVGTAAAALHRRRPDRTELLQPIRDGEVRDAELATILLKRLLRRVGGRLSVGPVVAATDPSGDPAALREVLRRAGAKRIELVAAPLAALAATAGSDILGGPRLLLSLGTCRSHAVLVDSGGVVAERLVPIGGETLLAALAYGFPGPGGEPLSPALALRLLREHADVSLAPGAGGTVALGSLRLPAWQITDCLSEPVERLVAAVRQVIRRCSGIQRDKLLDRGLILTGGPARLKGLDRVLERATNLDVTVAPRPELAIVEGLGALYGLTGQAGIGRTAQRRSGR